MAVLVAPSSPVHCACDRDALAQLRLAPGRPPRQLVAYCRLEGGQAGWPKARQKLAVLALPWLRGGISQRKLHGQR